MAQNGHGAMSDLSPLCMKADMESRSGSVIGAPRLAVKKCRSPRVMKQLMKLQATGSTGYFLGEMMLLLLKLILAIPSLVSLTGMFAELFWLVTFGTDLQTWATTGTWPSFTIGGMLAKASIPPPHTDLKGIQGIIDGVLALSGTIALLVVAIACLWLYSLIGDAIDRLTPKEPTKRKV
jgi:hypothetical protein